MTNRPLLVLPLLATCALAATPGLANAQEDPAVPLSYTRIYADAGGDSHFSDEAMDLELVTPGQGVPPTPASSPIPASGMRLFCPPAGGDAGWHPVPGRVINVVTSGEVEIEVSSGETRRFGPGAIIMGEDTTGRGHRTRVVGPARACFAMVVLPE